MSEYWATKTTLKFAVFISAIIGVLMAILGKSIGDGIVVAFGTLFFVAIFCKVRYEEKRRAQGIPRITYSTLELLEEVKKLGGEKKK